jgi:hypothetical protein
MTRPPIGKNGRRTSFDLSFRGMVYKSIFCDSFTLHPTLERPLRSRARDAQGLSLELGYILLVPTSTVKRGIDLYITI